MRKLLLAAVVAALGAPALAQEPPIVTIPDREHPPREEGQAPRGGHMRRRLFVSPSGEPFRSRDGLAEWFAGADADHDGAITLAEFRADAMRAFKLYDTNGDGVVDGFEIQAYERERVPEIDEIPFGGEGGPGGGGRRGGGGGRHGRHGGGEGPPSGGPGDGGAEAPSGEALMRGAGQEGAARYSLINEPQPLLAADADVDGKVSLAEWTRATDRRFALLDKAKTGRLTLESLRPEQKKK
jgi:hypothetical protein